MINKTDFFQNSQSCSTCYNYTQQGCSLHLKPPCGHYQELVSCDEKVSLADVVQVLAMLRETSASDIIVKRSTSASPKNPGRDKLLIMLDDTFGGNFAEEHPEFFLSYLCTIEPFMFVECLKYLGKTAYIFDYPCASHAIQIKVYMDFTDVVVVSFHKTGKRVAELRRVYEKTIERLELPGIVALSEYVQLRIAWTTLDPINFTHVRGTLWITSIADFFAQYEEAVISTVQYLLTEIRYAASLHRELNQITIYNTLALSGFVHDKGLVNLINSYNYLTAAGEISIDEIAQLTGGNNEI